VSDQERLFGGESSLKPWQGGLPTPDVNAPAPVHRFGHDTEYAAARLVEPRTGTLRAEALRAIAKAGDHGLTHNELAVVTDRRHYSIAPRCTELVEMGWVVDSGHRRPTETGSPAIVWILSEEARAGAGRVPVEAEGA
jgi:hypothetical protein